MRLWRCRAVSLVPTRAAAGPLVPLQATSRQERSPARLLPRVVGLSTASVPVAAPTGVLVTGFLIDGLGPHRTLLLMTAGAALIGATVLTSTATRLFDAAGLPAEGPCPAGIAEGSAAPNCAVGSATTRPQGPRSRQTATTTLPRARP